MLALELLAERKIAEAVSRGEFDALPGQGQPLELDDDPLVPEDMRMARRILKNSDFAPPEGMNKLSLLNAKIDARYFKKVARKLRR